MKGLSALTSASKLQRDRVERAPRNSTHSNTLTSDLESRLAYLLVLIAPVPGRFAERTYNIRSYDTKTAIIYKLH